MTLLYTNTMITLAKSLSLPLSPLLLSLSFPLPSLLFPSSLFSYLASFPYLLSTLASSFLSSPLSSSLHSTLNSLLISPRPFPPILSFLFFLYFFSFLSSSSLLSHLSSILSLSLQSYSPPSLSLPPSYLKLSSSFPSPFAYCTFSHSPGTLLRGKSERIRKDGGNGGGKEGGEFGRREGRKERRNVLKQYNERKIQVEIMEEEELLTRKNREIEINKSR